MSTGPTLSHVCGRFFEDRPDREAERRQQEGGGGDPTGGLGADGHEAATRDGLALEGARNLAI